jgi:hypothetical protein
MRQLHSSQAKMGLDHYPAMQFSNSFHEFFALHKSIESTYIPIIGTQKVFRSQQQDKGENS